MIITKAGGLVTIVIILSELDMQALHLIATDVPKDK
jgi:hypothetical protein